MKNEIPYKTIHRMMKKNCSTYKVGDDAVRQMIYFLNSIIQDVSFMSIVYARHDNRKTVNSNDVNLAIETIIKDVFAE
ncbi:MAG: NFYB/HAP3 family transcription factor subunit [Methanobrevibacter sp.]|nr:NFYB/HAP3 family transcription factor subunit [Methanobrevibacter sp.]